MNASFTEETVVFECAGESLVGIVSAPPRAAPNGVLIVVGGPQYRAGSHRQFTLLARHLAQAGIASLRFDYRGLGDSTGAPRTFEAVHDDIRCAIDRFFASVPPLHGIVIWGLCDAASAGLFYAHRDSRVAGLVLLNPWVRTEQGIARTHLRHYYAARVLQAGFWRKVAQGRFNVREAAAGLGRLVAAAMSRNRLPDAPEPAENAPLPVRMEQGLRSFRGRVLLITSGNDLTAREFKDLVAHSPEWRRLLLDARITQRELAEANHTFARRAWRDQVARWTAEWVERLGHP